MLERALFCEPSHESEPSHIRYRRRLHDHLSVPIVFLIWLAHSFPPSNRRSRGYLVSVRFRSTTTQQSVPAAILEATLERETLSCPFLTQSLHPASHRFPCSHQKQNACRNAILARPAPSGG